MGFEKSKEYVESIYNFLEVLYNKAKKLYDKFGFIEFGRNNVDYLLYYKIPPN